MPTNSTYYARKALGLCTRCGLESAAPGRTTCARCGTDEASRRRQTHLCTRCHQSPPKPRHRMCTACQAYMRQYQAAYVRKRDTRRQARASEEPP